MGKIAVSLKVDVSKVDKARLFKGAKGTYLDMTVFVDPDNQDQYGNNGMITQDVSKEERQGGVKGEILGNCKVFWQESGNQAQPQQQGGKLSQPAASAPPSNNFDDFVDDIPFN